MPCERNEKMFKKLWRHKGTSTQWTTRKVLKYNFWLLKRKLKGNEHLKPMWYQALGHCGGAHKVTFLTIVYVVWNMIMCYNPYISDTNNIWMLRWRWIRSPLIHTYTHTHTISSYTLILTYIAYPPCLSLLIHKKYKNI